MISIALDIEPKIIVKVGDDNGDPTNSDTKNAICDVMSMARNDAEPLVPGGGVVFHCTPPLKGRYVTIEKQSTMDIKFSEILVS